MKVWRKDPLLTGRESKNLRLIRKTDPSLFTILDGWHSTQVYHKITTPSGYPTLLYSGPNQSAQYLHDPRDPVQEAEQMIRDYEFRGEDITILMGFGLGYLPSAIRNRMHPDHRLFILEADPEVLLRACEAIDLTRLLTAPGIRIFAVDQTASLLKALEEEALRILAGRVNKLIYPPLYALHRETYDTAEQHIEAFIAEQKESFNTLTVHQDLVMENVLENLPAVMKAAPVDCLLSASAPGSAVVVSAGPSLDKNISILKGFENRFLIIAVDAAVMSLVCNGIVPDLVVSIDPNPVNGKKFDAVPSHLFSRLPLVFSPTVCPSIPPRFQGAKFVFGSPNQLCRWALSLMGGATELPTGFTVSHFAFYLARAMGADPIIFAGLDLAVSPVGDHAKHCPTSWNVDLNDPRLITVPGIHGDPVPTFPGFARMITLFEREIRNTGARCIDATEGGAYIPGTEIMTLEEAANGCPEHTPMQSTEPYRELWRKNRYSDIPKAAAAVTAFLEEAEVLYAMCRSALALLPQSLENRPTGIDFIQISEDRINLINGISDRVSVYEDFLEQVKDQMGEVLVDQFRLQYELDRIADIDRRRHRELEKSRRFFSRLVRITEGAIRAGQPVLKQLPKPSPCMPNIEGHPMPHFGGIE